MIERPGIYPRWPSWKAISNGFKRHDEQLAKADVELEYYVVNGRYPELPVLKGLRPSKRPQPEWEDVAACANLNLKNGALLLNAEIATQKAAFDTAAAAAAWVGLSAVQMVELMIHERFPRRFDGRNLRKLSLKDAMLLAQAFALGGRTQGERLGRLMLEAYRRDWYFNRDDYPALHFILRLFADWSGQPVPDWDPKPLQEPIMAALFDHWRSPDPEALAPYVLAACDYHTHRCRQSNAREYFEFNHLIWQRFPAEILMLYRLREYEGLANPQVDHPLMNSPLGVLPAPVTVWEPEPLTARVLARMREQGYDEDAIYRSICTG